MNKKNLKMGSIQIQAHREILDEDFRTAVEACKVELRKARWWHRVFPWVILIRRRGND